MNVLELVKKRREKTGYSFKKSDIDLAIVARIHKLFKLACIRFQNDYKLWLSHIAFAAGRNEKATVTRLYNRMLQIHNRRPALWIMAAKNELEVAKSMDNSRNILQRALRFNPESHKLWQEYFRMELLCVDQIMKRREVLGIADMDQEDHAAENIILQGKVAEIVHEKALKEFPDDVEFQISFLQICSCFSFTDNLQNSILLKLQSAHSNNELVWDAAARKHLQRAALLTSAENQSKKEKEIVTENLETECWMVYAEAVTVINTEKMWTMYLKTCLEQLEKKTSRKFMQRRVQKVLQVFEEAQRTGKVSAEMYLEWVEVLQNTGQAEMVLTVSQLGTSKHPHHVLLWYRRLQAAIQLTDANVDSVLPLVEKSLAAVPGKDGVPLWRLAIEYATVNAKDQVQPLLERGVSSCPEVCILAKELYLEWAATQHGVHKARELYKRFSSTAPVSIQFFTKYIAIESSQPSSKLKRLRQGYEDALREYGKDNTNIWLDYIRLEMSHPKGQPQGAGTLHWRAMKALNAEAADEFVTKYTLLQTGHVERLNRI